MLRNRTPRLFVTEGIAWLALDWTNVGSQMSNLGIQVRTFTSLNGCRWTAIEVVPRSTTAVFLVLFPERNAAVIKAH